MKERVTWIPSAKIRTGHGKKLTFSYEGKEETGEREKGEDGTRGSVEQEPLDLNRITMVTMLTMLEALAEIHLKMMTDQRDSRGSRKNCLDYLCCKGIAIKKKNVTK